MSRTIPGSCPEPEELGRAGWNILHTAAAVYPNKPSQAQQDGMRKFIEGWSQVYACGHCAYHMRQHVAKHPPVLKDKREASWYVCDMHNKVNKILDKEEFDCNPDVVLKRWHPTYPEMDDTPTIEEQIAQIRKEEAMKKGNTTPSASATSATPAASNSSSGGGGGGFFSWFGGGKKAPTEPTTSSNNNTTTTTQQAPPQPSATSAARHPAGGLDRIAQHELDVDPRIQSRWGNDPVFDDAERGRGAVRAGWNAGGAPRPDDAFKSRLASEGAPPPPPVASVMKGLADAAEHGSAATPIGGAAAETDISEIMKKVRACAVYCPEKDNNKTPGLGH